MQVHVAAAVVMAKQSWKGRRRMVLLAVIAAAVARLVLAWGWEGNYDQTSYEIVQEIVARGGNVYAETTRYNYTPIWFHLLGAFGWLQELTGLPAHGVIRTFLTGADLATAWVIYRLAPRFGIAPVASALVFLLNPVSILITGFHGAFDNLAVLVLLLSLGPASTRAAIALNAVAVIVKHSVAAAPLYLLAHRIPSLFHRLLVLAGVAALFLLTFLPWVADGQAGIVRNVLSYATGQDEGSGLVGFAWLLRIAILVAGAALATRMKPIQAATLWALLVVVTEPHVRDQFLVLPIAFGALHPTRGFWLYTIAATGVILFSINGLPFMPEVILPAFVAWIASLAWLLELLSPTWPRNGARDPA